MRSWLNGYGSTENIDGEDYTTDNFMDNAFLRSGQNFIYKRNAVRPALHLNLDSSLWNYAGTVTSDGTNKEDDSEAKGPKDLLCKGKGLQKGWHKKGLGEISSSQRQIIANQTSAGGKET